MPLVELVGGKQTAHEVIDIEPQLFLLILACFLFILKKRYLPLLLTDFLNQFGERPYGWLMIMLLQQKKLMMQFAMVLVLRWAQMGLFETYRLAGGEAGMRHFIAQFGPCLEWPWTHLMDVPDFTEELIDKVSNQSDDQSGQYSIDELMQKRDDNLVDFLKALKENRWGAGNLLKEYDENLSGSVKKIEFSDLDLSQPVDTYTTHIPKDWADYNGHMTEARYLDCFSEATTELMALIGADEEYIANVGSYFTVETHIRHLDEVLIGERIYSKTQVIYGQNKKLHLFHWLHHDDGRLLATAEHMLIHVDLKTRGASMPSDLVIDRMERLYSAHKKLPTPEGLSRAVGDKV